MDIPTRAQYDDAVRQASRFLKMSDEDLRNGTVEHAEFASTHGPISRPWAIEGGFAIVYRFKTRSGRVRALRCFTKAMPPDIHWRYEQIGPYFRSKVPALTAEVAYHDPGIAVRIAEYPTPHFERYPIIEMEWVEGVTLLERVDEACSNGERAVLQQLAESWRGVVRALKQAGIGHGDIAGNNIMVRPDGQLVLVDYDFIYIPAFAGSAVTVGFQDDYQHHDAVNRAFDEKMDDFSHMVVYTALVALADRPQLWAAYGPRGSVRAGTERGMLFTRDDFVRPDSSALFDELTRAPNPEVAGAALALLKASRAAIDQIVLYERLADPLLDALSSDDDLAIVAADDPATRASRPLDATAEARRLLAHQRVDALDRFRRAILAGDDARIVADYDPVLDNYTPVKIAWRERLDIARKRQDDLKHCLAAIAADSDADIIVACKPRYVLERLDPVALARTDLATTRSAAVRTFRIALSSQNDQAIAEAYKPILVGYSKLLDAEVRRAELAQKRLEDARQFRIALASRDDQRIVDAVKALPAQYAGFSAAERRMVDLARTRVAALQSFRIALKTEDDDLIFSSFDPILKDYSAIRVVEWSRLELAKRRRNALRTFRLTLQADDDERIASSFDPSLENHPKLLAAELQRLDLARRRQAALRRWHIALQSKNDERIVTSFDPILEGYSKLLDLELKLLAEARARRAQAASLKVPAP